MSGSRDRKSVTAGRRSGRRSLSAYGPHARGTRIFAQEERRLRAGAGLAEIPTALRTGFAGGAFSAAAALALLSPLARRGLRAMSAREAGQRMGSERTG